MKKFLVAVVAIMLALISLMPAIGVSADSPKIDVSGNFGLNTWSPFKVIEAGPNVTYFFDIGADWSGDLTGSDVGTGIEVDRADGRYVMNTLTIWTGDITIGSDTYSGTMQIITASRGIYPPAGPPIFTGQMTLVGLSGDLADVHGQLTFGGPPFPIVYSGWIVLGE